MLGMNFFSVFESHGHFQAHIWKKNLKNLLLRNQEADDSRVKFVSYYASVWVKSYTAIIVISKLVLVQHILSTQVSNTGPLVLWFIL